jgi:hypothetical protein
VCTRNVALAYSDAAWSRDGDRGPERLKTLRAPSPTRLQRVRWYPKCGAGGDVVLRDLAHIRPFGERRGGREASAAFRTVPTSSPKVLICGQIS